MDSLNYSHLHELMCILFHCVLPCSLAELFYCKYLHYRLSLILCYWTRLKESFLQELLAIQQQGPRAIGFFGTRNMGFMHQELIEILSYAMVITVRCYECDKQSSYIAFEYWVYWHLAKLYFYRLWGRYPTLYIDLFDFRLMIVVSYGIPAPNIHFHFLDKVFFCETTTFPCRKITYIRQGHLALMQPSSGVL